MILHIYMIMHIYTCSTCEVMLMKVYATCNRHIDKRIALCIQLLAQSLPITSLAVSVIQQAMDFCEDIMQNPAISQNWLLPPVQLCMWICCLYEPNNRVSFLTKTFLSMVIRATRNQRTLLYCCEKKTCGHRWASTCTLSICVR